MLWVKGSGGDIGSMKLDGFSTLYLDKLVGLKGLYRGLAHEDEMVALFNHCTFNLNPRATSIDTPLHAFVPHAHVDHVHADAVIAIAASANAEELTSACSAASSASCPWQRPGFDLGLKLGEMAAKHPEYVGVVLGGHGLFTWAATSKACYETTLRIIDQAAEWLAANDKQPAFGGERVDRREPRQAPRSRSAADAAHPRQDFGRRAQGRPFHRRAEVLEFVNSSALSQLAPLGTSCPDHFLRTKIRPLVLAYDPAADNLEAVAAALDDSSPPIAPTTPAITSAASTPTRRRCAIPTR